MNDTIFFFFYNLAHQSIFFDKLIIFFADTFPYIVILFAAIYSFFYKKDWKDFFIIFAFSGLSWFLAYIFKFLIHTERPFDIFPQINSLFNETGYAFPSGHATFFMTLAVFIFLFQKRNGLSTRIGYLFIFFALLIGISRIIAGVHFPIDILGGFILGFSVAFFLKNV